MAGRYHRNGRMIRTGPRNPLSTDEISAITGGFKTAGAINPPTSLPEVLMVADATKFHYDNGEVLDKGLKGGALSLVSSIVIGVASTAPAYSLAATLGFVAILAGTQTVIVVILAFVPIFLISFGYKELNRREPDCGTTFTWGTKAFGPT